MKYCVGSNPETQRKLYDGTVEPEDGSDILLAAELPQGT
jgi:hypothetical protein